MAKKDVLKDIIAKKKERLALAKQAVSEEGLKARASEQSAPRPFIAAVSRPKTISLIAEIKKQSPSHGLIRPDFDPAAIASVYQSAGVQAISVLTEEDHFAGSPAFIETVKAASSVPVLRKDFLIEPYQIYESRAYGADAVLLIADILSKDSLIEMISLASGMGMGCLVEVHDEKELKKVLGLKVPDPSGASGAKKQADVKFAIGINSRDLRTLECDPRIIEKLYPLIPKDRVVVAESGLKSYQDILFLKVLGVNAVLVGGSILSASDMEIFIQDLMGW